MLFNIEGDTGSRITGYVVPDNFTTQPTLAIRSKGETILTFQANDTREALVAAGRHGTGQCGFVIDGDLLPGLDGVADLEVAELETETLIYRRRLPHHVGKRILRLETHLLPLWRLDECFRNSFQYAANGIEQQGRETVTQMFLLNGIDSVYLSGRILYKNYAFYAEGGFNTILVLHHPYDEMAERLLVLRNIEKVGADKLGMRDSMALKPAVEFAAELPLDEEKALARALRRMSPEVASVLANPLVRQLTASTPDEMPGRTAITTALDELASFAIVGLRREPSTFLSAVAEMLQVEPASLPEISVIPSVESLAGKLRRSREVDRLIDKDLELYSYVAAAFEKVA